MTSWTARIDALPPLLGDDAYDNLYDPSDMRRVEADQVAALRARLALAAERLKEPHAFECLVNRIVYSGSGNETRVDCTCGKDSDLLRIMEGR